MNRMSFVVMYALISILSILSTEAALTQSQCWGLASDVCGNTNGCKFDETSQECLYANNYAMDVVFVMDCSRSVSASVWDKMTKFVKDSIRLLDGGDASTQFGIITFNQLASVKYGMSVGYQQAMDALDAVAYEVYSGDSTTSRYTLNAVRKSIQLLSNPASTNKKLVILLTNGIEDGPNTNCLNQNGAVGGQGICTSCTGNALNTYDYNRQTQVGKTMLHRMAEFGINFATVYFDFGSLSTSTLDCLREGDSNGHDSSMSLPTNSGNFDVDIAQFTDSLYYFESNGLSRRRRVRRLLKMMNA